MLNISTFKVYQPFGGLVGRRLCKLLDMLVGFQTILVTFCVSQ